MYFSKIRVSMMRVSMIRKKHVSMMHACVMHVKNGDERTNQPTNKAILGVGRTSGVSSRVAIKKQ